MRELLRTALKVILIFAIIGVFVNDGAAYLYTRYQGQDVAKQVAESFAAEYGQSQSIGAALSKAQETAANLGVNLIEYKVEGEAVSVTIELKIQKTVIIERVKALSKFAKVKVTASADLT